ncbi:MAG: carboxypeptidase regulatory-like domain-containing protein [Ignavibacteriales bacterium]
MKKTTINFLFITMFISGFFSQIYSEIPVPANLKASVSRMEMGKGVLLNWDYPSKILVKFNIYRRDGGISDTGSFKRLEKTTNIPYFMDVNVVSGKKYTYYITASAASQESQPSNKAEVSVIFTDSSRATITGRLISDSQSNPVIKGKIQFIPVNPVMIPCFVYAVSDSSGKFSTKVTPGSYYVYASAEKFIGEFYNNAKSTDQAKVVTVSSGTPVDLTISLAPFVQSVPYTIKGSVKNADGKPVRSKISVFRMNAVINTGKGSPGKENSKEACNLTGGSTDDMGNYTVRVNSNDTVVVFASPYSEYDHTSGQGYQAQYYNKKKTLQEADKLVISSNLTDINFILESKQVLNNSISGKVVDSLFQGVASGIVAYRISDGKYGFIKSGNLTDSTGVYSLTNLIPGKYILQAIPRAGYMPSYYRQDGKPVFERKYADTLAITESTVLSNINFTVKKINRIKGPGTISGFIKDKDGKGVNGALSLVADEKGNLAGYAIADGKGQYTVDGLTAGTYSLSADMFEYEETAPEYVSLTSANVIPVVSFTMVMASVTSTPENEGIAPAEYTLKQNYPNPFNPSTTIKFSITNNGFVTLKVYNILGKEVATLMNEEKAAGSYSVVFNARNIPSGIYFYTLTSGKFTETKKLVLLK